MSKRINVMISNRLNEKLDNYSERYGVSKSSIVGFVVGQWIDQVESFNSMELHMGMDAHTKEALDNHIKSNKITI
jgi:predicted DNA-binding protein